MYLGGWPPLQLSDAREAPCTVGAFVSTYISHEQVHGFIQAQCVHEILLDGIINANKEKKD